MKKSLVFLAALVMAPTVFGFGYKVRIKNETDGQIKVRLIMRGPGVCENRERIINSGREANLEVGLCCTDTMYVEALSGTAYKTGKSKYEHETPRTGWGMSCQGYTTVVINTANGGLSAYNE